MSLDAFHRGLARLVSDPGLVKRTRQGDAGWLRDLGLTTSEMGRLRRMAADERMAVMCSLYRSNRLTALVRTVPEVVEALGRRLESSVSEFWTSHPRRDMQFRSEGEAFCRFIRVRYPQDFALQAAVNQAEVALAASYDRAPNPRPG